VLRFVRAYKSRVFGLMLRGTDRDSDFGSDGWASKTRSARKIADPNALQMTVADRTARQERADFNCVRDTKSSWIMPSDCGARAESRCCAAASAAASLATIDVVDILDLLTI